jgi:hypothetical protein
MNNMYEISKQFHKPIEDRIAELNGFFTKNDIANVSQFISHELGRSWHPVAISAEIQTNIPYEHDGLSGNIYYKLIINGYGHNGLNIQTGKTSGKIGESLHPSYVDEDTKKQIHDIVIGKIDLLEKEIIQVRGNNLASEISGLIKCLSA